MTEHEEDIDREGDDTQILDEIFSGSDDADLTGKIKSMAEFIAVEEDHIAQLDRQMKDRKANVDQMKIGLATLMMNNGLQSAKLDNGLTPSASVKTQYFKSCNDETLFAWLEEKQLDGIIKRMVHFSTLSSTLKDFVDQGNELPTDLFTQSDTPTIRMNGKSKFLAARKAS